MSQEDLANEIAMHQQTIATDANSPLQLIRERELEISGRMLSAKREADDIVAAARKKAAEVVSEAEAEGGTGARNQEQTIVAAAEAEAATMRKNAQAEAAEITASIEARKASAIQLVVDAVTAV